MNSQKNEAGNLLPLTVSAGLTVNVLPSQAHEYLMTTKEVAAGYGVTSYAIQKAFQRCSAELSKNKHFIFGVDNLSTRGIVPHNAVLWTKRGIVRLGFFIKSERARFFRDWAEDLIIAVSRPPLSTSRPLPAKRNHNRLTSERLIRLLALTNKIADWHLREAISNALLGKEAHDGTF